MTEQDAQVLKRPLGAMSVLALSVRSIEPNEQDAERNYMSVGTKVTSLSASACFGMAAFFTATLTGSAAQANDTLWGGGSAWGGDRQVVSFSPKYHKGQIIVSFGDRRLYYIHKRGTALSYPIAIPRKDARWQGKTSVSMKKKNPAWTPTPTMLRKNPRLPSWVPGGHPMNPLGVRALYLGSSTYRIHGTDAPWTIGTAASSGCIRMFNKDVLDLYPRVRLGARVTVTWKRYNTSGSYNSAGYDYDEQPRKRVR